MGVKEQEWRAEWEGKRAGLWMLTLRKGAGSKHRRCIAAVALDWTGVQGPSEPPQVTPCHYKSERAVPGHSGTIRVTPGHYGSLRAITGHSGPLRVTSGHHGLILAITRLPLLQIYDPTCRDSDHLYWFYSIIRSSQRDELIVSL